DGYYEVDLAGNFTFFNDSMCEISGYSRDELMGMNYRQYTNEQDSEKLYNTLNKVYTTGKPSRIMDHMMVRKDGTERHIELSGSLIKDSEGHRIGFRGIIRDVTERKKLESQLIQSQKMETIGILAGGVAHDLNNILSGIISYPELLLMDLPEGSPLRKPLLTIKSSGERAAVVVQDLLTMARRGVTITEIVNLNSIISEQLKSPECEKLKSFHLNVDIKTNLEKDLLNIKGSTAHLSKTVMNLISNAAEAMPDGGKVLISTENLYIDRPIRGYDHVNEGDYMTVMVSDTGIGISKKDMNRIFEPFYTKKVMGRSGTGLGMAVVWGTVKDHNGYIDVKSTKGKGTTFTLYFPVIRQELAIDKSLISIEDYMGKGESILIVDDVEEQMEIASVMLNKLGYSVKSVSSGEEAIEYMKDNSADLLVLDMIMDPGIDGLDTYKKILKLHPKQKAIIASGFSETDRVKKAKKLGAGAYVKKPYVLEKIGLVIKEELEK
ncbi:MAG: PAS domain S-box protein, partial [Desulfobacteraceae bacterium]|nr:PAS domain S-box protein [Desulfobacteraceae bacterium]